MSRKPVTLDMRSLGSTCLLTLWSLVCCLPAVFSQAAEEESTPAEPVEVVSAEQIDQWILQLDDDRFDYRQQAQQQLSETRPAPLKKVMNKARQGSLESATRALNILLEWSESKDNTLRFNTLAQLASLKHRPREAAMATRILAEERERVALQEFVKLGAQVSDLQLGGVANRQVLLDKRWKGGDEGLKHVQNIRRVTLLRVHCATVSDAGLLHLQQLPEIQRIELYGTSATPDGIAKLMSKYRANTIEARSGALLGVLGNQGGPCTVTEVVTESAAEKAGIKTGDRILEFNGMKVETFQGLTELIAKKKPGDTVTLLVQRKGEIKELKATFDEWGAKENPRLAPPGFNQIQVRGAIPRNQIVPRNTLPERR